MMNQRSAAGSTGGDFAAEDDDVAQRGEQVQSHSFNIGFNHIHI